MQHAGVMIVNMLLEEGANPNKLTLDGKTPLALAARVRAMRSFIMFAVNGSPTAVSQVHAVCAGWHCRMAA